MYIYVVCIPYVGVGVSVCARTHAYIDGNITLLQDSAWRVGRTEREAEALGERPPSPLSWNYGPPE